MTDAQLQRALQSVGLAAFVTHLELFQGAEDTAGAAARLQAATGWAETACLTRVRYARAILAAGRRNDALARVAQSDKVAQATRALARQMLGG